MKKTIEETIYSMLVENTGIHMMDSGGENGRAWQRNAGKTLADFEAEPVVDVDTITDEKNSSEISFSVSTYHYLTRVLTLDDLCHKFNALKVDDWDSEQAYGLSKKGEAWLEKHGLTIGEIWNTYNGEEVLSQTLQGANVSAEGDALEYPTYILLQVHGGADVRGGYTDAKLFKVAGEYFNPCPIVYGSINGVQVETGYNGSTLTNENGEHIDVKPGDTVDLYFEEC